MAFFVFFMCFSLLIVCPHLNMVVWAPLEMFIPPLLDPYCAPTLDTKDSNIRELGKIGSDKTKLYDPGPGFHLYSLLQTRLDEQSKQHEPAPFFLNFYCGSVFTSFLSIPSFHKSNAFFKHFKQNRVRAVYQ